MSTGECRSVTYMLRHGGDRGEWAGGTTATVGGGLGAGVRRRMSDAGRLLRTAMDLMLEFSCTGAHWLLTKRARAQADWLTGLVGSDHKRRARECTFE